MVPGKIMTSEQWYKLSANTDELDSDKPAQYTKMYILFLGNAVLNKNSHKSKHFECNQTNINIYIKCRPDFIESDHER